MKKSIKLGQTGLCEDQLIHWDTPYISGTVEATNFQFGREMNGSECCRKKYNIRPKGAMWGSRDPLFNFWDPLISWERLKLQTSNLAQRWLAVSIDEKSIKLGQTGLCEDQLIHFWNFGTPLISRERLKLQTSNLAQRWMAVILTLQV